MDAENSTIPSTAIMPRLLAQMTNHGSSPDFFHFLCFSMHFVHVFHCFLFSTGSTARGEVEGWTFGVARQPGSSSVPEREPTLESVWKFTEITGTVDLKPFSVGCRWKWFMVETMISILSLCNDKWLGRSALEAKCSSLLDKAQFTEKSWWRYWARWLFGWFFPDVCCH